MFLVFIQGYIWYHIMLHTKYIKTPCSQHLLASTQRYNNVVTVGTTSKH